MVEESKSVVDYLFRGGLADRWFVDPQGRVYEFINLMPFADYRHVCAEIRFSTGRIKPITLDDHIYDQEATPEEVKTGRRIRGPLAAKEGQLAQRASPVESRINFCGHEPDGHERVTLDD